jgi:Protein of unknown function (DUF3562)
VPTAATSKRNLPAPDPASVAALAEQTGTPEDLARQVYDEEVKALDAGSTVKNFIGVIARRRARQRLSALKSGTHRSPGSAANLGTDTTDTPPESAPRRQRRA